MGKNKRSQVKIFDVFKKCQVDLDSIEEWEFYNFCMECLQLGLILSYDYQPITWTLSERKTYAPYIQEKKQKEKFLLADHVFSPDFKIVLNKDNSQVFSNYFKLLQTQQDENGNPIVYIDTKGTFQRFGGDRAFSVNVKWTYDKYGIYVQKVIPKECFSKLGVPEECKITRSTKKPCKKFVGMKTIPTIFNIQK